MRRPVIGIVGAGECTPAAKRAAGDLGRLVAEAGWVLLTGGRPAGVMDAASAGAKSVAGSLTVGILPSGPDGPVSTHVDLAVFTGMGDARNAINVLSSDVVIACGVEGPGTASEVALSLASDRPVILLAAAPEAAAFFSTIARASPLLEADTPEAAMKLIEELLGRSGT
jgi:uncharacterized protein (TIGR00725 family)